MFSGKIAERNPVFQKKGKSYYFCATYADKFGQALDCITPLGRETVLESWIRHWRERTRKMYIYINEKCVGGDSGREVYTLSHNLLLAHAEAVEEFRKCAKTCGFKSKQCKDGKIGIVHSPMWFEPYKKSSSDEIVKRAMDFTLASHDLFNVAFEMFRRDSSNWLRQHPTFTVSGVNEIPNKEISTLNAKKNVQVEYGESSTSTAATYT
ncbi:Glycoside hydrolase family 1 protein [Raphanus sativus]|nr:Glycoside hydrolase family 1 protein [Raphanus sativus]